MCMYWSKYIFVGHAKLYYDICVVFVLIVNGVPLSRINLLLIMLYSFLVHHSKVSHPTTVTTPLFALVDQLLLYPTTLTKQKTTPLQTHISGHQTSEAPFPSFFRWVFAASLGGVGICYDCRFPELALAMRAEGAKA